MDDIWEFLWFIVAICGLFCVVGGIVLGGVAYGIVKPSCYAYWADSGMAVRWSFYGGCQLQMANGKWLADGAYLALNKHVTVTP